jgi:uncharacterized membrane protein
MRSLVRLPPWLIPMAYVIATVVAAMAVPRLERAYLGSYSSGLSPDTAVAVFSCVASGMMALIGIVFAISFVVVQFNAVAYSPRLVAIYGNDPMLFHTLGVFTGTFGYSLAALAWTDRNQSGTVPPLSAVIVAALLIASMLLFARLVQKVGDLQISLVLHRLGEQGRVVIRETFGRIDEDQGGTADNAAAAELELGPVVQELSYSGRPFVIARFDIPALVLAARAAGAVIEIQCAVGDTLVEDMALLRVHGAAAPLPEATLLRAIHLARERTFKQDPRYAIRLLVDIAIRALSPAINDPTTAVQALDQIEDLLRRLGRSRLDAGRAYDADGALRLVFPMPTWQDYLELAFDEIRQYGATSIQVVRRLRSALIGLAETVRTEARRGPVRRYLEHLNLGIEISQFDDLDRSTARDEDRQGLGLSRRRSPAPEPGKAQAGAST